MSIFVFQGLTTLTKVVVRHQYRPIQIIAITVTKLMLPKKVDNTVKMYETLFKGNTKLQ